ncbi:TPA: hypothetical protein DE059_01405 [Candidatus Peribacteria bacterium]|nr:hypothetical protein [Candidatus Peribacteria bacterium]
MTIDKYTFRGKFVNRSPTHRLIVHKGDLYMQMSALIIDVDYKTRLNATIALQKLNFKEASIVEVDAISDAKKALLTGTFSVVVSGWRINDATARDIFEGMEAPPPALVLMSGDYDRPELQAFAKQMGAELIPQPIDRDVLKAAITRAMQ